MKLRPLVGIGVMILKEQGVLLLKRKGSHGEGEWCLPGGHLKFGETFEECAKREVLEETGLEVKSFKLISVSNDLRYLKTDNKHYVTIGIIADYQGGEPQIMEPEKASAIGWFSLDNLPSEFLQGSANIIKAYKSRKVYNSRGVYNP